MEIESTNSILKELFQYLKIDTIKQDDQGHFNLVVDDKYEFDVGVLSDKIFAVTNIGAYPENLNMRGMLFQELAKFSLSIFYNHNISIYIDSESKQIQLFGNIRIEHAEVQTLASFLTVFIYAQESLLKICDNTKEVERLKQYEYHE